MTEVLDYLEDILDGVEKIKRYTQEMTYEEFVDDPKAVDAARQTCFASAVWTIC